MKLKIATLAGDREVEGEEVAPGLAVHPSQWDITDKPARWKVTHIRSGMSVTGGVEFTQRLGAVAFAALLADGHGARARHLSLVARHGTEAR